MTAPQDEFAAIVGEQLSSVEFVRTISNFILTADLSLLFRGQQYV